MPFKTLVYAFNFLSVFLLYNYNPLNMARYSDQEKQNEYVRELMELQKLTPEEKFCLTAYFFTEGKSSDKLIMAYQLSRKREPKENVNPENFYQIAHRWISRKRCQIFLDRLKAKYALIKQEVKESEENTDEEILSNDEILKKLSNEVKRAERECKHEQALKGLIALSEVKRKQGQKEDEKKIHFFMPKKCYSCVFKKYYFKQNTRKDLENK